MNDRMATSTILALDLERYFWLTPKENSMYTLCLQRAFTARHYLIGGDWGRENQPHAHPYRVEIRLSAEGLDAHGYLVDLAELEPILDACVGHYQDQLLNDLPEFDQTNPSIEHLARRFCHRFGQRLGNLSFSAVEVRIWENDLAWASYQEAL
jgi:6-pyruvoyltetrahydropterin/6-carboxytetrahydropterin synthase